MNYSANFKSDANAVGGRALKNTNVTYTKGMNEYILYINSDYGEISKVEVFIDKLNEEFKFGDDIYGNIIISITEAVNNGIKHGNKLDSNKKVKIISKMLKPSEISFTVVDEGTGFDPNQVPDPLDPARQYEESGRGVFVMQHLADSVEYKGKGNEVEMRFHII